MKQHDSIRPITWQDDHLELLDQRILPGEYTFVKYTDAHAVADAIRDMVVRGAPAIGITAAYGIVLSARQHYGSQPENWFTAMQTDLDYLAASRPTAINLFWAIDRMKKRAAELQGDPVPALLAEAHAILEEDIAANHRMGELAAELIEAGSGVLTHCNAGALATGGYGTALGVIRSAWGQGKLTAVYADETRPWLQGARLTAWELLQDGIPVNLNTDGAAAWLMKQGKVQWVIVGSDRIAANGDVANKIGTYNLAVAAKYHGVKFMVAAPTSTIDMNVASGAEIPIETRDGAEILSLGGKRVAAEGAGTWNPVFDVTPAELVDYIVTEAGVVARPSLDKMNKLISRT
ncbi:MAG: S-methyl-5-thioribose-1-phosphate isomerase [Gammaproteobacteria bacterium]|nr:S-methyl-5-thioribose-1-phosphate isomerase [Gammaproteobacteria bacterium]MDH5652106.1 S-methyl-5-thioribose-1-phosphate isomerase [Gammaproteobacteria bacterium]